MTGPEYTIVPIQNNPGIFYEAIGKVRISETTWTLINYVDLTNILGILQGLRNELDLATKRCNELRENCLPRHSHQLVELKTKLEKLTQYRDHVYATVIKNRIKRAPLEFIGRISKILFGTLTDEDAVHINEAIRHVENKTNDLATLLINQTIATRTRFGELYNATLKVRAQQTQLYQYLQGNLKKSSDQFMQNDIHFQFENIIESLDYALLEHEVDLNTLIDGILFGKQGLIHPRIIPPEKLFEDSKLIKEQIPNVEFPVAINKEEIDHLIKISKLHIAYFSHRLVYVMHIPLIEPASYILYKSWPLPAQQKFNTTIFATLDADIAYIALNEDADSFYEFREDELATCTNDDSTYICPSIFPMKKIRQTPTCNTELLLNHAITNQCNIILRELRDTYWKALHTTGSWIYTTSGRETIRIECVKYNKQTEITGSGIITVRPGCKIRATTAIMSHPSTHTTKTLHHYILFNNLSIPELYEPIRRRYDINLTEVTNEIWPSDISNVEATFNDIILKAGQIKERKLQRIYYFASNIIAYSIGLLGALALIIFIIRSLSWTQISVNYIRRLCCDRIKKHKEDKGLDELRHDEPERDKNLVHNAPGAQSSTEPLH